MFSGSRALPTIVGASGSKASTKNNDDLPLSATPMIVNMIMPGYHPQVIEHETIDVNSRHVTIEIVNDGRNVHLSQKGKAKVKLQRINKSSKWLVKWSQLPKKRFDAALPKMPLLSEWVQSVASKLDD
ncbi:hypothetical protein V6N11_052471 [Hibiscus sabdariffa]|uniref:Uncharacterized protein n=1 Tax=Hibiscus sabdariffa TaxID=183260 RepID=A0ABR2UA42_9ROSI